MDRRNFLALGAAFTGAGVISMGLFSRTGAASAGGKFEIEYSEAQWLERLTAEQFRVLRQHGTELAGSSALNHEKRPGTFHCAACDLPLYDASTKFESGTGWPSFFKPLDNAIGVTEDRGFFMVRTEIHCRRCGGHLGHVFDDGPPPTGLRYCMNGVSLKFKPAAQS